MRAARVLSSLVLLMAIMMSVLQTSAMAGRPYEVTFRSIASSGCHMQSFEGTVVIWPNPGSTPEQSPCDTNVSVDEVGNLSGGFILDASQGASTYGNGRSGVEFELRFQVPRPVYEIPIEARFRIDEALLSIEGPRDASGAEIRTELWFAGGPPCDSCYWMAPIAAQSVELFGVGERHGGGNELDLSGVLRHSDPAKPLSAGEYHVRLDVEALGALQQNDDIVRAVFDMQLLDVSLANHRSQMEP